MALISLIRYVKPLKVLSMNKWWIYFDYDFKSITDNVVGKVKNKEDGLRILRWLRFYLDRDELYSQLVEDSKDSYKVILSDKDINIEVFIEEMEGNLLTTDIVNKICTLKY